MEAIAPWLTPALMLALFAWLKRDMRDLRKEIRDEISGLRKEIRTEISDFRKEVHARFDGVNARFDAVTREIGDLRERMAKLEGTLEGFVAGRRDRNAAA